MKNKSVKIVVESTLDNYDVFVPDENATFKINISRMTAKDLAAALRGMAQVIEAASDGHDSVKSDTGFYVSESLDWYSKFSWENGYDESDVSKNRILTSWRKTSDGMWEIRINDRFVDAAKSGIVLTAWMKGNVE